MRPSVFILRPQFVGGGVDVPMALRRDGSGRRGAKRRPMGKLVNWTGQTA